MGHTNTCCEGGGGGGGDSDDEEDTEDLLDFPEDPEEPSEEAELDAEEEADPEPADDSFESYFFTGLGGEGNSSQFTQPSLP